MTDIAIEYKCKYCQDTKMTADYLGEQDIVFETFPCPNCNKDEHKIWREEYDRHSN